MLKIYVTNLSLYNAGILHGEWIDLPCDKTELDKKCNEISRNGKDELFITDYETDLEISKDEFANINALNEFTEDFEGLDEWQQETVKALLEYGYNIDEVIDKSEYCTLYEGMDFYDLAEELINECYSVPEGLENYIDYEKFGRDLEYSGEYAEVSNGILYLGY